MSAEADGEEDTVKGSVVQGLKAACSDPKVWLLVIIQTGAVMGKHNIRHLFRLLTSEGMSFTYFFPSIVATLGYPRGEHESQIIIDKHCTN